MREFGNVRRIVIKIGSSSLAYPSGKLRLARIEKLVREMADLHNAGREVLVVTSGAIGAGVGRLGLKERPRSIPALQACAAVGQGILMHTYEKFFAEYGIIAAQVLLTREDFAERRRFLNARNTLETLLRLRAVPIINENDTIAVEEIKLGDNDQLSALVAVSVNANLLLLLSDVDGLYTADPRTDAGARRIPEVTGITPEIEKLTGAPGSALGTGGVATKLMAARIAVHSGVAMVIAPATEDNVIRRVLEGEDLGTVFWPVPHKLKNRKRWIAFGATVQGRVFVDAGAATALALHGKSLLPSGVVGVSGEFGAGSTVSVIGPDGREIARGIVNYSSSELERIKGVQTAEITHILGEPRCDEVIHRDNLVLE
ncbi:MAG: Glutamate 5-kinase [Clostridia bacterium 62_21]|nr:MAG: Glutamate 5-kinase [Clostridia bacterium 62_21]HAG07367.1 glutamate 5-kinase [Peptococcaceae bacterium]